MKLKLAQETLRNLTHKTIAAVGLDPNHGNSSFSLLCQFKKNK